MKRVLALFTAAVMMTASFTGCGKTADTAKSNAAATSAPTETKKSEAPVDKANKKLKLAWLSNTNADEPNIWMGKNFKEQANKLGFELVIFDGQNDIQKQTGQISEAIALGVDGIFINPVDRKAIVPAMMKAKEQGIKLATVSSDITEEKYRHFFVGPNDIEAGEHAAKLMKEHFKNGANIVMVEGEAGHDAAIKRNDGFVKGIEGSNIKLLDSQASPWDPAKAMSITEDFITKYGDKIQGIYSHWDNASLAIVEALEAKKMADKVFIVSVDGNRVGFDLVRQGKIYATVYQDMAEQVKVAAETMLALQKGEKVQSTINPPLKVITKENAGSIDPGW